MEAEPAEQSTKLAIVASSHLDKVLCRYALRWLIGWSPLWSLRRRLDLGRLRRFWHTEAALARYVGTPEGAERNCLVLATNRLSNQSPLVWRSSLI
jgi:hypothetical protein